MKLMIVLASSFLILASLTFQVTAANQFVGVKECKKCHKKKKDGNQFGQWQASGHAKAFETLGSDEAKQLAKKLGVKTAPQKAKECLICHAAPLYDAKGKKRGKASFAKKFKMAEGVQCEVCHGAGKAYKKKKTMKKITKEGGAAKSALAKKTGLIFPDESVCVRCHVAKINVGGVDYINPTFKDFDFKARYKEIQHPKP